MNFRKVCLPIVLVVTLMLQFLPGTLFAPRQVSAAACDVAQFIADVTIPDGTNLSPGTTVVKTWRLKNIGSCTWTTSYSAVFTSGDQMGAPAVVNLPSSVAPGATVDISVNITAPSTPGHYRGNWKLRNGSGVVFGVGSTGAYDFWVDIFVSTSYSSTYDFVANYCSAAWSSGAGSLPCPGTDGDARGFVNLLSNPQLENGSSNPNPGLLVNPQHVAGGYIRGVYPAYLVQAGDRFQSLIDCAYNATNCYVNFKLQYQIGSGPVQTLWSFNERHEGLFYRVNLDLSSLAGQNVKFILYLADVSGYGTPSGDRAQWVETKIARAGAGPLPPIPPSPTCDKGAFVADVTIPDGSVVAPGSSFTKTWRIRNVGSCTWTTSYALVFVFGDPFGASPVINLPSSVAPVAPGATADFSVAMVAPSVPGHYRSYWRFRNASGVQFGVGSGMITFFADINVAAVGPNPTTTTITADTPDPSVPGQSVPVSVSVTGASLTPTGTVTITGADTNCSVTLSSGSGTCNVVFNSTGAKVLSAIYSGDFAYASSSDTESHTVASGSVSASITTLSEAPDPSTPGQTVAVTATVTGSGVNPTGSVAITGADANCTITLSGGTGTCNVVFNSAGAKILTGSYSGDANYASSSDTENHTVSGSINASTTAITADTPDPSIPGQVVAVTATVTGAGTIPTGSVVITGAETNCTITLAGGTGSCNAIFTTTGSKTLTGTYGGNANYAGSTDTESHTVATGLAASATTITSHVPDPSTPGQPVVVKVTVSGAGIPTPTGTITIAGADSNCSFLLGSANSCSVTFNTTGHKTLTASYSGDANYAPSSGSEGHVVTKGSATTTITADTPDPSKPGQAVTVSVSVLGAGFTPTGTVNITGADVNCSLTLSGGSGSCGVIFNSIGHDKPLTATYNGDSNYLVSTDTELHDVMNPSTTTIISDNADPSVPGEMIAVYVTVSGAGVDPTGDVFITGADVPCTIHLSGGTGHCHPVFLSAGAKILTATYEGDGNYAGSVATTNHTVEKGAPEMEFQSITPGSPVTNEVVTITIRVHGDGLTPTGTVAITVTGVPASTCTVSLSEIGFGHAEGSCTLQFAAVGSYTIRATYSGDTNYILSWIEATPFIVH